MKIIVDGFHWVGVLMMKTFKTQLRYYGFRGEDFFNS